MIRTCTENNQRVAFEHLVEIKKQDKNTVVVEGNTYSFKTKRGLLKQYIGFYSYEAYRKSEYYPTQPERCNGFLFVQLK